MGAHRMDIALEQLFVPEHRQIIEDRVVLAEGHVVRQARSGQGNGHIVDELAGQIDNAVMHIGRIF